MKPVIVVPTIREESIKQFIQEWEEQIKQTNSTLIVVQDGSYEKTFKLPHWVKHYARYDIEKELGNDAEIIMQRSSAIRNFGTLMALKIKGCDMILHLDDDCFPTTGYEIESHHKNLYDPEPLKRWMSTDIQGRPIRGLPYKNVTETPDIVVSHGTWTQNADYDAAHQLANRYEFYPRVCIVPKGTYFSMCGMNLAFKPKVAAAMYFAPSGRENTYDRIDDIWMGVIAKKVFDECNYYCYTGWPRVRHERASDPFYAMMAESKSLEVNEYFWQYIDEIELSSTKFEYKLREISYYMQEQPLNGLDYFKSYGEYLERWTYLCQGN